MQAAARFLSFFADFHPQEFRNQNDFLRAFVPATPLLPSIELFVVPARRFFLPNAATTHIDDETYHEPSCTSCSTAYLLTISVEEGLMDR